MNGIKDTGNTAVDRIVGTAYNLANKEAHSSTPNKDNPTILAHILHSSILEANRLASSYEVQEVQITRPAVDSFSNCLLLTPIKLP